MQSTDGNSEDKLNEACAELLKIFSDPSRPPQKAYRTYLLTFENGEVRPIRSTVCVMRAFMSRRF
jgi:hypothetical protein